MDLRKFFSMTAWIVLPWLGIGAGGCGLQGAPQDRGTVIQADGESPEQIPEGDANADGGTDSDTNTDIDTDTESGTGSNADPDNLPIIDCSGAPALQTGVNLTPAYTDIPSYSLPAAILGELRPATMDLSEFLPTPCNQGQLRSCVAWQVGYGMMTYFASSRLEDWGAPDRADKQFSPTFLFNQANAFLKGRSRADSCQRSGSFVSDVLGFIQENGCALMSDVPFVNDMDCNAQPSKEAQDRALQFRIAYYRRIEHDVNTFKAYLAQELPPVVVINVGDVFNNLSGPHLYDQRENGGAHALLIAGYDDNLRAFKMFNSWGQNWGDGGYAWISYDIFPDVVREAWVAAPNFSNDRGDLVSGFAVTDNPYVDSDGDGFPDSMEREFADHGFDPNNMDEPNADLLLLPDADFDGWPTDIEFFFGTDPNDAAGYPFGAGFNYPPGFFDEYFEDGGQGILESDLDLLDPLDTSDDDNDGVPGSTDLCPDTRAGLPVGPDGCPFTL